MHQKLGLIVLAVALTGYALASGKDCQDYNFRGCLESNITIDATIHYVSLETCQRMCQEYHTTNGVKCQTFVWHRNMLTCFILEGTLAKFVAGCSIHTGPKNTKDSSLCLAAPGHALNQTEMLGDCKKDVNGKELELLLNLGDESLCQIVCENKPECSRYSFHTQSGACVLRADSGQNPTDCAIVAGAPTTAIPTTTTSTTRTTNAPTSTTAVGPKFYYPKGPQLNVPVSKVTSNGWRVCFNQTYDNSMYNMFDKIRDELCRGEKIIMACRQTGSDDLTLLAAAPREDVFRVTSTTGRKGQISNGSKFYVWSHMVWGFGGLEDDVDGSSGPCDYENGDDRLCWFLTGSGGYRCGSAKGLNRRTDWQEMIFTTVN